MIQSEIIADSLNEHGHRCTTFVLDFPRIVLAEYNTHRQLTRSSASSRAIPFDRMCKRVLENPFIPIKWMKAHKGMQGHEYFEDDWPESANLHDEWLYARDNAIRQARRLDEIGLTKQFSNRLLEPFAWHRIITTATDWQNFFALRAHEAAEIHIQDLAYKMLKCYNESEPKRLKAGEWHIPFGDRFDDERIYDLLCKENTNPDGSPQTEFSDKQFEQIKCQISVARAARVSYLNFEGKDDYKADLELYHRLLNMKHMAPFENVARAMTCDEKERWVRGLGEWNADKTALIFDEESKGWCGNFQGFVQHRKLLPNENQTDERIIKK